jgi:hypothetical protein
MDNEKEPLLAQWRGQIEGLAGKYQSDLKSVANNLIYILIAVGMSMIWIVVYFGLLLWNPDVVKFLITGKIFPTIFLSLNFLFIFFFSLYVIGASIKVFFSASFSRIVRPAYLSILAGGMVVIELLHIAAGITYFIYLFVEPGLYTSPYWTTGNADSNNVELIFIIFTCIFEILAVLATLFFLYQFIVHVLQLIQIRGANNWDLLNAFIVHDTTDKSQIHMMLGIGSVPEKQAPNSGVVFNTSKQMGGVRPFGFKN